MFFAGKRFRQNAFQARRILIVSGAAAVVTLVAVAAWTVVFSGGPAATRSVADSARFAGVATPSTTETSQNDRPAAERAARAAARTPRKATPVKKSRPAAKPKAAARVIASGTCEASFYDEPQDTASGEQFDPNAMTAAHKTLPLGSKVRVINKGNGDSVTVRINDRGPYIAGRCIDLSRAAMAEVGGIGSGVIQVRYEVLSRA